MHLSSKVGPSRRAPAGRASFRPILEQVEDRVQPGSLLFGLSLEADLTLPGRTPRDADQELFRLPAAEPRADRFELVAQTPEAGAAAADRTGQTETPPSAARTVTLPASWTPGAAAAPRLALAAGQGLTNAQALVQTAGSQAVHTPAAAQGVASRTPAPADRLLAARELAVGQLQTAALAATRVPLSLRAVDLPVTTHRFDTPAGPGPETSLIYSTFFGQDGEDTGRAIAVDAENNTFATGSFGYGEDRDLFITRVDANGRLVWVSTFGASGTDEGRSIDLDSEGNIYVTGYYTNDQGDQEAIIGRFARDGSVRYILAFENEGADSANGVRVVGDNYFVTGTIARAEGSIVLMARLTLEGELVAGVGLGLPGGSVGGNGITADADGNSYIAGTVTTPDSGQDFALLSLDGNAQLRYARFLPHVGEDAALGITLYDAPMVGLQVLFTGVFANEEMGSDGFIVRAAAATGGFDTVTLLTSGVGPVASNGIVTDAMGTAVVAGSLGIGKDNLEGIVVKLLPGGGLDYFFLSGVGHDVAVGITRGNANAVYVVGTTGSEDFPITEGAFQPAYGGGPSDAWGGLFGLD